MSITKKQKEVFEFIKEYTRTNEMAPTLKEIKDHFGLKSFGSVSRYITYLIEAKYLERDWNKRQGLKIIKEDNSRSNLIEIPLLGNIAAGVPIEAIENPTATLEVPSFMLALGHKHYALTIQGNSMIDDHICDGDIAIIKYQKTAEQGQTVVAIIDGDATLKQFYSHRSHIELRPKNETMKPIMVNPHESNFQIAGILVGLIRSF
jgi:repressor LexA